MFLIWCIDVTGIKLYVYINAYCVWTALIPSQRIVPQQTIIWNSKSITSLEWDDDILFGLLVRHFLKSEDRYSLFKKNSSAAEKW